MAEDPDVLYDAAVSLLAAIESAFADYGVDLPERRFVYGGDLEAFDCRQLAVAARSVQNGQPGRGGPAFVQRQGPRMRYATLRATLLRCAPNPNNQGHVSSEALQANGQTMLRDRWILYNGVFKKWLDGSFLESCSDAAFTVSEAVDEQGALIGSTLTVEAQI